MKDINDDEISDFIAFTKDHPVEVVYRVYAFQRKQMEQQSGHDTKRHSEYH
jgi:hypothetical protein